LKTLVLTNQKGGVGKSTIAVHAAWFLAERGRVLFIDLDGQRNATRSLAPHISKTATIALFQGQQMVPANGLITLTYATTDLPDVEAEGQEILDTFRANVAAAAPLYDYCVVDTPPAWCLRTLAGILIADAILSPISLGDYAVQGSVDLLKAIEGVAQVYAVPKPDFLGLLPNLYERKSPRQKGVLEGLVAGHPALMFPAELSRRDAFELAVAEALPPWRMKTKSAKAAADEMRAVLTIVADRLEGGRDERR
jgi:chromosome partitioning protein